MERPDSGGRVEPPGSGGSGGASRETGGRAAGFRIRPFRDGDEDDVVALWRACDLVRPWNDPGRDIERARAAGSCELFVAVPGEGDEPVAGSVMVGFDGHRGWVYYLAVAPRFRSRGLGGRLMRHAEARLERIGAPKAMLMIREENEGVRRFYESLGYGVEKRTIMSRWVAGTPAAEAG